MTHAASRRADHPRRPVHHDLAAGGDLRPARPNTFGRQVDSFDTDLSIARLDGGPCRGVFIHAPRAERAGENTEALAAQPRTGKIVPVRQGPALATAFHPELTGDRRIHELFVTIVRQGS